MKIKFLLLIVVLFFSSFAFDTLKVENKNETYNMGISLLDHFNVSLFYNDTLSSDSIIVKPTLLVDDFKNDRYTYILSEVKGDTFDGCRSFHAFDYEKSQVVIRYFTQQGSTLYSTITYEKVKVDEQVPTCVTFNHMYIIENTQVHYFVKDQKRDEIHLISKTSSDKAYDMVYTKDNLVYVSRSYRPTVCRKNILQDKNFYTVDLSGRLVKSTTINRVIIQSHGIKKLRIK
ncbi:MAG: hypothetical protein PHF86_03220 [Candidatus Nanoarchaeia archaeon]|nr:hypothetical protein [Candidatus Nanoarchaeia archaeon]